MNMSEWRCWKIFERDDIFSITVAVGDSVYSMLCLAKDIAGLEL